MKPEATSKYSVPALDKTFEIFDWLAANPSPKTQAEIAQGIGRSANEIYRILVNLEQNGYLNRDGLSGRYHLSLKLYNLSRTISPIDQLRQTAIPIMDDLAADIGLSCYLSILHQSKTMVLIHTRSQSPISLNIAEGSLFSSLHSNAGKLLMANSNQEVRALILQREPDFADYTVQQKAKLYAALQTIRAQSDLAAPSHLLSGIYEYSVLIGEPEGKVIASLTVCAFEQELKLHALPSEKVIKAAQSITQQLSL